MISRQNRAIEVAVKNFPPIIASTIIVRLANSQHDPDAEELVSEVLRTTQVTVEEPCTLTMAHTRSSCGHVECRES